MTNHICSQHMWKLSDTLGFLSKVFSHLTMGMLSAFTIDTSFMLLGQFL